MKKIVITGALGYIGTELCKLYSGFSWKYEVVAIDNNQDSINELNRGGCRIPEPLLKGMISDSVRSIALSSIAA